MDSSIQGETPQRARYHRANEWPAEIPSLTYIEAERAVRHLYRKFLGRAPRTRTGKITIRRVWVPRKPPFNTLERGWRRLVHDISHRIHGSLSPSYRPHDWRHEKLEAEMVQYVIDHGWLAGKLKPEDKPKIPAKDKRYRSVLARIETWQRKLRRAERALKKLQRQRAYYERSSGMIARGGAPLAQVALAEGGYGLAADEEGAVLAPDI